MSRYKTSLSFLPVAFHVFQTKQENLSMNRTIQKFAVSVVVAIVFQSVSPLSAALISPASITASASSQIGAFSREAIHAVNSDGLTGGQHTNVPNGNMWLSTAPGFGGLDANPYYQVDLGAIYNLDNIHVWNYNENGETARGVQSITVLTSTTDATLATNTNQGTTTITQASSLNTYTGVDILLGGNPASFTARYLRFQINSNYGDTGPFYGLAEVQFFSAPVPEPSAIVLLGTGMTALLLRRRRSNQK